MALAGFAEEDLDIIQRENSLVIEGKAKSRDDDVDFLHQGIANRAFKRSFELADHVKVTGANLENGLLTVDLERELPEALKPRKIEIAKGSPSSLVNKAKKLLSNEDQFAA
jgi:molecular chaperone IbpA